VPTSDRLQSMTGLAISDSHRANSRVAARWSRRIVKVAQVRGHRFGVARGSVRDRGNGGLTLRGPDAVGLARLVIWSPRSGTKPSHRVGAEAEPVAVVKRY
jgi:hypothetical protein